MDYGADGGLVWADSICDTYLGYPIGLGEGLSASFFWGGQRDDSFLLLATVIPCQWLDAIYAIASHGRSTPTPT